MQKPKRKIEFLTWVNILFGSLISKMLIIVFTSILIILIEVLRHSNNYLRLLPAILLISIYLILYLITYYKIVRLFKYGVMTKGKIINKEKTLLYNRTPFGLYPYYKYHFKFKDVGGKEYKFSRYATENSLGKTKESFVLYSISNPNKAVNTGSIDGGPYSVDDERVTSRGRIFNLIAAAVFIIGIAQVISALVF